MSHHTKKVDAEAELVLRMRDKGMTLKEIATELGWSISRVNRREHRAKRNIQRDLGRFERGLDRCSSEVRELWGIVYALRLEIAGLKAEAKTKART